MKRRIFKIALDKNALFEVAHKYGKVKIEGARGKNALCQGIFVCQRYALENAKKKVDAATTPIWHIGTGARARFNRPHRSGEMSARAIERARASTSRLFCVKHHSS